MSTDAYILKRLEAIERELAELRRRLQEPNGAKGEERDPPLYGVLRGIEFSEDDFEDAKRSLFRDGERD